PSFPYTPLFRSHLFPPSVEALKKMLTGDPLWFPLWPKTTYRLPLFGSAFPAGGHSHPPQCTALSSTMVVFHVLPWSVETETNLRPPAPGAPAGDVGVKGLLGSAGGVFSRVMA